MIYIDEGVLELLGEKKFSNELIALDNDDQVKQHFAKHGVDISDKDMEEIRNIIQKTVLCVDELENSELENISGGVFLSTVLIPIVAAIAVGGLTAAKVKRINDETDEKIWQAICETVKMINSINVKGERDLQRIESMERIAGYVLASVVVVSAVNYFKNDIKKWWNSPE